MIIEYLKKKPRRMILARTTQIMPNISGDVIFLSFMEYKANKVLIQLSNLRPVKALYSRDNKYDTNRQRLAPSPC